MLSKSFVYSFGRVVQGYSVALKLTVWFLMVGAWGVMQR